ncbi:formin-like protein 6 [Miscanthus floridulus]|uniref:formin-like protein 6 n=1 Tax=Miscanthus floridulus TaxID=154761 RepID=UPI003457FD3F
MQPPTGRRREPPGAARGGELTRQEPPPAGPGRLFFMPAPPGHHHRPFSMPPPPAPPGRSHSNQPPPADPPSASSRPAPPPPPPPPLPPPHAYGDYDRAGAPDELPRRPPHHAPLPPPHRPASSPCSSALASCLVATAFLLLSAGGAGTALFLLFRPRPPDIAVAAVRLPSFSASNGTVAFTFEQTAAVRNPNRSPLAHFDSSLRVAYAGGELGAVYIPAGLIDGGSTKHVSAVFDVPAIPVAAQSQPPAVIEVHSLLVVKGRVNVLRVLTHRVQAAKLCRVGVSPLDGTVLGFRC